MRITLILPAFALAACATGTAITGPAVEAALGLPTAQFAATMTVARQVANGCPAYGFSENRAQALAAARGPEPTNRVGISLEEDVILRSFQARYGVTVGQESTCSAIEQAIADGGAISAVLIPA